jgi:hypothetical protein
MTNPKSIIIFIVLIAVAAGFFIYRQSQQFPLPQGETTAVDRQKGGSQNKNQAEFINSSETGEKTVMDKGVTKSNRKISITDSVKHSIPLNEILSGGPPKDGIPSIDDPKFWTLAQAGNFLDKDDIGLGLEYKRETRFYPFRILVWHEIVNDTVEGDPVLVTYCPLCLTGVAFDRKVVGVAQEFGVSGRLWQSNLLMYNRASKEDDESLWSQVLGEAVLGVNTGEKLKIIPTDIVRWEDWKKVHPNTKVLSTDTGSGRNYSLDPYGDYYTSEQVSFGASFNDSRLHPKAVVVGIEIDGKYKAYSTEALSEGETKDNFAERDITINKDSAGRIRISANGEEVSTVWGFWFSWLAVHPNTELFK